MHSIAQQASQQFRQIETAIEAPHGFGERALRFLGISVGVASVIERLVRVACLCDDPIHSRVIRHRRDLSLTQYQIKQI